MTNSLQIVADGIMDSAIDALNRMEILNSWLNVSNYADACNVTLTTEQCERVQRVLNAYIASGSTGTNGYYHNVTARLENADAVTIAKLNETDDPKSFGGERLGDDGVNELWLFGEKVANRSCANDPDVEGGTVVTWDDDVEGWNYNPETDALQ